MKRTIICLLALCSLASAGTSAVMAAGTEIVAPGSGSVALPPDIATINASIESNAESANDAISKNNAAYNRVLAALERLGVARNDITLAYYNVNYNPRPQAGPAGPGERYGYTVSRSFSVKARKIGDAGRVSDACMSNGATAINDVSFGLSDPTAAREQATARAVEQARANAEAIARAATLRIIGIKSIELAGGAQGPVPLMRVAAAPSTPTAFDQSPVNVTVSLTVTFLAEP